MGPLRIIRDATLTAVHSLVRLHPQPRACQNDQATTNPRVHRLAALLRVRHDHRLSQIGIPSLVGTSPTRSFTTSRLEIVLDSTRPGVRHHHHLICACTHHEYLLDARLKDRIAAPVWQYRKRRLQVTIQGGRMAMHRLRVLVKSAINKSAEPGVSM